MGLFSDDAFDELDKSIFDQLGLTRQHRIIGFLLFLAIGWIISGLSFISIANPVRFCVFYSIGNIISLCSGFILWGLCSQLKSMFQPTRLIASTLYITFLVLTLVAANQHWNVFVVLVFAFCQWLASIWYLLSYIPYARSMICFCCKSQGLLLP